MAERTLPEVKKSAPAFSLGDAEGKKHALKDYLGKWVVLYFYPKDDTPGCTVEACDFRDEMETLADRGAVVLGVSPDSAASHGKFRLKHKLNFTLLSDPDKTMMTKYGAWGEKTLYGKKSLGVIRSTFLIDPKGKVAHVWANVKAKGHVAQVRQARGAGSVIRSEVLTTSGARSPITCGRLDEARLSPAGLAPAGNAPPHHALQRTSALIDASPAGEGD